MSFLSKEIKLIAQIWQRIVFCQWCGEINALGNLSQEQTKKNKSNFTKKLDGNYKKKCLLLLIACSRTVNRNKFGFEFMKI